MAGSVRCTKCGSFVAVTNGTYIDSKGYLAISAGPLRGVRVHELVAAAKYGYEKLGTGLYHISHEDNNKLNPHPDNLLLRTISDHNAKSAREAAFKRKLEKQERAYWDEWFSRYGSQVTDVSFEPQTFNDEEAS